MDLSWEGVRLERPFVGGERFSEAQLEIEVVGIDEVIWAKAGACFDQVMPAPVSSPLGGPLGLVRRTGYRLLAAASRDLRLLKEYLFEQRRAEQARGVRAFEPESQPARARPLPSILAHDLARATRAAAVAASRS